MYKVCVKCKQEKDFTFFSKNKKSKDGVSLYCKECEKERIKKYRNENPEKSKISSKNWRDNNPGKQKKSYEKYIKKNPHMLSSNRLREYRKNDEFRLKENEQQRKYYIKNLEKIRQRSKDYYHKNKKKLLEKNNEWKKNKRKTDPIFRMKKNIRDRIKKYLFDKTLSERTFKIIGLNYDDFKLYIESLFVENMTWENYGQWHIDHIKPLCLAKSDNDVLLFNHYTNLQPLWGDDNLKKNRKYDG